MLPNAILLTETEPKRFLRRALLQLRWLTILALLLITIMQPSPSTIGVPTWGLIVLFAGYNLLVELLRNRMPDQFSFAWLAILDLPSRMEQIIVNLVDNAHRHTPSGTHIRIAGTLDENEVHVSVSDDGPGIPASELEGIFERFHSLTPGNGGSGLGLAIVKSIVELHSGRIGVVSESGQGASFHMVLPCATSASSGGH